MEFTAYNSGFGNYLANASLNSNLLSSLSNGVSNLSSTDLGIFDLGSLSRAEASQSWNISTNPNGIVSKVAGNSTASGSITSVVGTGNTLNAAGENAILSVVGNNNVLNGGSGNDTLSAVGDGNTLTGGNGNDILSAEGNNTLIGGNGNDTFVIPSIYLSSSGTGKAVQGQSLIQDFQLESDKLQLPTITTVVTNARSATSSFRVVDFKELTLTSNGQNTYISYQGNPLAELQNIPANQLKESDFVQPRSVTVQGLIISPN